jgi:outer membrane protein
MTWRVSFISLIVTGVLLPATGWAEEPLTLETCYRLALRRSEQIAIQQELLRQTEGRFLQALSGALPSASFVASEKRQDGSGGSAFTLKEVPERKFTFSQPLFSGFKEFAAMAGTRAEKRQRIHEKLRAEHLLLIDVTDAFYLLRQQREDLLALETIRATLTERMSELEERERLGRSRPSERASVEARLRRLEAEIERVRSQETTARQLLEFLTGLSHIDAITDDADALPALQPEETYVAKVDRRPDVLAAEEAWQVAKKNVTIAKADYWPTVDLDSNYYTKRVGASGGVDWDVLLTVDVPLFQGGEVVGAVKEAKSESRRAKLEQEQTRREATLEIRQVYATLAATVSRRRALEKALAAAEQNYLLQREDYEHGLVNNLNVLQTLQELQDARRDVIQVIYEERRQYWQLRAATGESLL